MKICIFQVVYYVRYVGCIKSFSSIWLQNETVWDTSKTQCTVVDIVIMYYITPWEDKTIKFTLICSLKSSIVGS